jgi:hypothetical protein
VKTQHPWELISVPNYSTAANVSTEQSGSLDERRFWDMYVRQNRPCLIKDAVAGWPAQKLWSDLDYLTSKIGDLEVRASCRPKVERFGLRSKEKDAIASEATLSRLLPSEKVRSILPRLKTPDDEVLFIELRPKHEMTDSLGQDLAIDGKRFPFLPYPPEPRFLYAVWAAMFYKNSYSDWHFHPGTEAIMCQVIGTKEVILLPPDQRSWNVIVPIHRDNWEVYDVDLNKFPAFGTITPLRATVEPGDGLFIPVNWWHAVQARPREYGVTVPLSWDSKFCDLRQPATRYFLQSLWQMRKPLAVKMFVEAARTTLVNGIRPTSAT